MNWGLPHMQCIVWQISCNKHKTCAINRASTVWQWIAGWGWWFVPWYVRQLYEFLPPNSIGIALLPVLYSFLKLPSGLMIDSTKHLLSDARRGLCLSFSLNLMPRGPDWLRPIYRAQRTARILQFIACIVGSRFIAPVLQFITKWVGHNLLCPFYNSRSFFLWSLSWNRPVARQISSASCNS